MMMRTRLSTRVAATWANLAPRERRLITLGLSVLLPVALYFYLWQPLAAERARLDERVGQQRGALAQLRADSEEVQRLRAQAPVRGASSLIATARLAAARFQLEDKLTEVTPQGDERLQVEMREVAFAAWLRWIGELGVQGVTLDACQVDALPTPGQVRARATLLRGNP